jgi:hypothetical protein
MLNAISKTTVTTRHLEIAMLDLLDCANNDAACREAYMKWDAFALEEAVAHHNLCGAVHRTRAEWRKHPQGKALMELPVITIEKIGDSAPEPFTTAERPLSGIRILDYTHIIAAPMVGNSLAEQGADVLHIACHKLECVTTNWIDTGFGKLACVLDLDTTRDINRFNDLVQDGCGIVEGYAPGRMDKRGLLRTPLGPASSGLIYLCESAYGHVAPWALRKGWDNLAQAATGVMIDHGSENSPVPAPPIYLTDYGTGYPGALGEVAMDERRKKLTSRLQEGIASSFHPTAAIDEVNNSAVLIETETGLGTLTHMAPVIQCSRAIAFWERPVVYLGASKAEWPER